MSDDNDRVFNEIVINSDCIEKKIGSEYASIFSAYKKFGETLIQARKEFQNSGNIEPTLQAINDFKAQIREILPTFQYGQIKEYFTQLLKDLEYELNWDQNSTSDNYPESFYRKIEMVLGWKVPTIKSLCERRTK